MSSPGQRSLRNRTSVGARESGPWGRGASSGIQLPGNGLTCLLERRAEKPWFRYFYNVIVVASDLYLMRNRIVVLVKQLSTRVSPPLRRVYLLRQDVLRELFENSEVARVEFYGYVRMAHPAGPGTYGTFIIINRYRWRFLNHLASMRRRAHRPKERKP
jgi:hypothetical protein